MAGVKLVTPNVQVRSVFTQPLYHKQFNRLEFRIFFFFFRPVAIPRLKIPVCPDCLPIAGGRIIRCIPFTEVLALCEMQTAMSSVWNRFAVSISFHHKRHIRKRFGSVSLTVRRKYGRTRLVTSQKTTYDQPGIFGFKSNYFLLLKNDRDIFIYNLI